MPVTRPDQKYEIIEIFSTAAFPSLTYTETDWANVRLFDDVEFYFEVTTRDTVTDLYAAIEYTDDPDSSRVFPVTIEQLDAGPPVVVNQYEYSVVAADAFSATKSYYSVPCPVHGQFMRIKFYGDPIGADEVRVWIHKMRKF